MKELNVGDCITYTGDNDLGIIYEITGTLVKIQWFAEPYAPSSLELKQILDHEGTWYIAHRGKEALVAKLKHQAVAK